MTCECCSLHPYASVSIAVTQKLHAFLANSKYLYAGAQKVLNNASNKGGELAIGPKSPKTPEKAAGKSPSKAAAGATKAVKKVTPEKEPAAKKQDGGDAHAAIGEVEVRVKEEFKPPPLTSSLENIVMKMDGIHERDPGFAHELQDLLKTLASQHTKPE